MDDEKRYDFFISVRSVEYVAADVAEKDLDGWKMYAFEPAGGDMFRISYRRPSNYSNVERILLPTPDMLYRLAARISSGGCNICPYSDAICPRWQGWGSDPKTWPCRVAMHKLDELEK